jgi:hypothetical protein
LMRSIGFMRSPGYPAATMIAKSAFSQGGAPAHLH